MSDPAPATAPLVQPPEPVRSWLGALQGLWLLTWKSQFTWRRSLVLGASILLVPALAYFTIRTADLRAYLHWTVEFYLMVVLPLYCLFVCGAIIRDEVQADTMGFLLTRPLTRAQLFLLKYICQIAWLEMIAGLNCLFLVLGGTLRNIPDIGTLARLYLGAQVLAIIAYGALSALLGLIHQRYLVMGIVYGFVVELGIGQIPTNINSLSLSHHVQTILGNSPAIYRTYEWSPERTFSSIFIMCLATSVFLTVGAVLFTHKEFHHSEEMQK